jgi:predicted nucleic acid-binding protein
MVGKILLDSVILIDHLNGIPAATAYLTKVHLNAVISAVTRAEVLAGYDPAGGPPIKQLLDAFPVLSLDAPVADLAAVLRRQNKWKLPDAFQAALAQTHKLQLATRNTKDFPSDRYDFVTVPYEL